MMLTRGAPLNQWFELSGPATIMINRGPRGRLQLNFEAPETTRIVRVERKKHKPADLQDIQPTIDELIAEGV